MSSPLSSPSTMIRSNPVIQDLEDDGDAEEGRVLRFEAVLAATPVLTSVRNHRRGITKKEIDKIGDLVERLSLGNDGKDENEPSPSSSSPGKKRKSKTPSKEIKALGNFDPSKGFYSLQLQDKSDQFVTVKRSLRHL